MITSLVLSLFIHIIVELNEEIIIEGNSTDADPTFVYIDGNQIYSDTGIDFSTSIVTSSYCKHWIVTTAKADDETVSNSTYFYVRQEAIVEDLPQGIVLGINYIDEETVVLYPNPVINNLTITNTEDIKQIIIYNMLGKIVYSESYSNNKIIVINTVYSNLGYNIAKLATS